jgi:hypothetical protein
MAIRGCALARAEGSLETHWSSLSDSLPYRSEFASPSSFARGNPGQFKTRPPSSAVSSSVTRSGYGCVSGTKLTADQSCGRERARWFDGFHEGFLHQAAQLAAFL